jgi:hypothetical protein
MNSSSTTDVANHPPKCGNERFTAGSFPYIPGIVKLYQFPGIAGGEIHQERRS